MASFHAELLLGSHEQSGTHALPAYPIDICSQHMQQDLDFRGRPSTKPYSGELHITMPSPRDAQLVAWAKEQDKSRTCSVVFRELDGVSASLILTLENAYCMSYAEHFVTDPATGQVSYFCQLSITAGRITKHGTAFTNPWNPAE